MVDGEVQEWIERLYESYGTSPETAPASASVLALGESLVYRLRKLSVLLKKMEALGWSIKPRRWDLLADTGKIVQQADDDRIGEIDLADHSEVGKRPSSIAGTRIAACFQHLSGWTELLKK